VDIAYRLRAAGCVFAEDEAALLVAEFTGDALEVAVARRVAGEPLELVLGFVEFGALRLAVAPGVFVPRRRTELVARRAIRALPAGGRLVDLCCGVGAIAALVASRRPDAVVLAADVDPVAVSVARTNLTEFGATAVVANMAEGLEGPFNVITACPPYVPTAEIAFMPREAREFEPATALDGGQDGTDLQAAVFAAAAKLLSPGGVAIVETSRAQAERTCERAVEAGLSPSVGHSKALGAAIVIASA
jgi:release factor glutamine methyltransferase